MNWFGNSVKAWGVTLASLMCLGVTTPALSQGFEDDYAQQWEYLEDDTTAIQQVGCFSASSSLCGGPSCGSSCSSCCDSGCDSCCPPPTCCPPWWAHRSSGMVQWLFLRPGSTDLVYTVEQNNVPANAFPTGPLGETRIDISSGVRAGFSCCLSECSSFIGSATHWQGEVEDMIEASPGNILISEVLHPSRLNTGAASLRDAASHEIDFQLADLGFRRLWWNTNKSAINWKAGVQYGNMDQDFRYSQLDAVGVGLVSARSQIGFDGFGLMGGLDFERYSCQTGLSIYGKGSASALAGEWTAMYADSADQIFGGVVANNYKDYRVTPMTELEIGAAWQNECGNIRVNVGYMTTAWYDALSTRTYIDSVRQGRFIDVGETITFSGLVLGAELRF